MFEMCDKTDVLLLEAFNLLEQHSFVGITGILLDHKADVNVQDENGETALHYAASLQRSAEENVTDSAKLLLHAKVCGCACVLMRKSDACANFFSLMHSLSFSFVSLVRACA